MQKAALLEDCIASDKAHQQAAGTTGGPKLWHLLPAALHSQAPRRLLLVFNHITLWHMIAPPDVGVDVLWQSMTGDLYHKVVTTLQQQQQQRADSAAWHGLAQHAGRSTVLSALAVTATCCPASCCTNTLVC